LQNLSHARASLRLNVLLTSVAFIIVSAAALVLIDSGFLLLAVIANGFAVFSETISDSRLGISYAVGDVRTPISVISSRSVLSLFVYLLLVYMEINVLVAFAVARMIAGVVGYALSRVMARIERGGFSSMRVIFRMQMPLAISLAMGNLRSLDNLIVTLAVGATSSGLYAAVSKVIQPFAIAPMALAPVVIPWASRSAALAVRRVLDQLFYCAIILSAITLLALPFSGRIVTLIFGAGFSGGGLVLTAVLLRLGSTCFSPLMSAILQACRLDRLVATNAIFVTVVTLLGVFAGAAIWGAVGAAVGYTVASVLGMTVLWMRGRRELNEPKAIRKTHE